MSFFEGRRFSYCFPGASHVGRRLDGELTSNEMRASVLESMGSHVAQRFDDELTSNKHESFEVSSG